MEAFEKWYETYEPTRPYVITCFSDVQAAYLAGYKAGMEQGMERSAALAEEDCCNDLDCECDACSVARNIADTIRSESENN